MRSGQVSHEAGPIPTFPHPIPRPEPHTTVPGCGLLGTVLSRLGCDVTMTEVPEAMDNLQANVQANLRKAKSDVRAIQMDWTSACDIEEATKGMKGGYDVVVGTDVVFNKALVDPLLRCIHTLSGPQTTVWLCLNERCKDAHAVCSRFPPSLACLAYSRRILLTHLCLRLLCHPQELVSQACLFFDCVDR